MYLLNVIYLIVFAFLVPGDLAIIVFSWFGMIQFRFVVLLMRASVDTVYSNPFVESAVYCNLLYKICFMPKTTYVHM